MEPIEIISLADYVSSICELNTGENDVFLYRGQSDVNYQLLPSIGRTEDDPFNNLQLERKFIEIARYKMPDLFRNDMLPLDLLALLQHHGIPTRLLDVTANSLVALFFSCFSEKNLDKDGEVLVFFHKEIIFADYPFVQAIADTYRLFLPNSRFAPLKVFIESASYQEYFSEYNLQLKYIREDKEIHKLVDLEGTFSEICKTPIFVYAPVRTMRQQMQIGRYILFPNYINHPKNGIDYFINKIKPIQKDDACIRQRFIIKKEAKQKLLQDLKFMGISREALFCDNVDIVCEEIKNTFLT